MCRERNEGSVCGETMEVISTIRHRTVQEQTAAESKQKNDLPKELLPMVEPMAKHVHDVWMRTRMEQGWTYGKERNDNEKKHPCLVPYEELPEEEKDYDRKTSIETLRFIIGHGFRIEKDS